MKNTLRLALVLGSPVASVLLVGCSGGDNGANSTQQFIKQGQPPGAHGPLKAAPGGAPPAGAAGKTGAPGAASAE